MEVAGRTVYDPASIMCASEIPKYRNRRKNHGPYRITGKTARHKRDPAGCVFPKPVCSEIIQKMRLYADRNGKLEKGHVLSDGKILIANAGTASPAPYSFVEPRTVMDGSVQ